MPAPSDQFWDVRSREREEVDHLQRDILTLQVQLDTVRKVETLRHAPGFQDFVQSVQAQHALAREKLIGDSNLTNDGLREQRGRVKGLESVLALLTKDQIGSVLAQQLAERKNLLEETLKRRPQPKQEAVT